MLGWFRKKRKGKENEADSSAVEPVESAQESEEEKESEVASPHPEPSYDEIEKTQEEGQQEDSDTEDNSFASQQEAIPQEEPSIEPESSADHAQKEEHTIQEETEGKVEQEPLGSLEENAPVETPKKSSFFKKLSDKLTNTREAFTYQIDTLFLGKKEIDANRLDDLEELLITSDLGIQITQDLLEHARRKVKRKELSDPESLKKVLKKKIRQYISEHDKPAELVMPKKGPFVIMVVGVNGVGKTTSIGKIAHKFIQSGRSVLLVAGDTFRAAAVSQLSIWAERNGVDIVSRENADPSSVAFDAMDKAKAGKYDVVLVDTAGRLHTQTNLMEALKKIKRVIGKQIPGAPHEVMLVIDATTGQNGVSQAKLFDAAVDITGINLTKLDGTAKGGIVANIGREMKTPIRFIGIGEQVDDLRDFDAEEFVDALFQTKN